MSKEQHENVSPFLGKPFPEFFLPDQEGKAHTLAQYRGQFVVLYSYPKDDTPGCTMEACGFRNRRPELAQAKAVVLGISILDSQSKAKFAAKYKLNFPLLSDQEGTYLNKIGVWKEKSMFGKTYMGVSRETFIIGPDGNLAMHWPKAEGSDNHSAEVLKWLDSHKGE